MDELAEHFISTKVLNGTQIKYAINLDGGSSSTMVETVRRDGKVRIVNNPFCYDIPYKCERPVATVLCFLQNQTRTLFDKLAVEATGG